MAETVHLTLKLNGNVVQGDSTQTSLGRENTIECLSYEESASSGDKKAQGSVRQGPITIRKRADRSTPLLEKALFNNERADGIFRFYRPDPAGDGSTQQFLTIELTNARISSIRRVSPYTIDPETASEPVCEEVTFTVNNVRWTYEANGTSFSSNGAP